jgi:hypothetical protein
MFDPTTATHIVTETDEKNTLRALGLKNLSDIPLEIPTVKWNWVISGKLIPGEKDRQQMDYEFMHAAFPSRMDAGRTLTTGKGKGKQKLDVNAGQPPPSGAQRRGETPCVLSRVFCPNQCMLICLLCLCESPQAAPSDSSSRESSLAIGEEEPRDLLEGPPLQMRGGRETDVRTCCAIMILPLVMTKHSSLDTAAVSPVRRQVRALRLTMQRHGKS